MATLTVHTTQFHVEDEPYDGMNITSTYRLEKTATGVRAVRQGEIAIAYANIPAGTRLTSKQISARAVVRNHVEDVLQAEFELDELPLPESLARIGKVVPTQIRTTGGWLVLGANAVK
jgi:hypothetical protein